MTTITKTIVKTTKTTYHCGCCNIECKLKTDFNRHLLTSKHIANSKSVENESNNDMENIIADLRRQLEEQKDKYDYLKEELTEEFKEKIEEQKEVFEQKLANQKEKYEDKLANQKENYEERLAEQKDTINKLIERPQAINPVYPSLLSLPEKTVFNRDTFLNEDCKDAMNVDEFEKLLNVTEDDFKSFLTIEKVSVGDVATSILKRNLKQVGKLKRPFHFTDVSRNVKYAKNNENKWVLVDETQEIFKNWIDKINKQVCHLLQETRKKNLPLNNYTLDAIYVKAQFKYCDSPGASTLRNDVINSLGKSCFIKD